MTTTEPLTADLRRRTIRRQAIERRLALTDDQLAGLGQRVCEHLLTEFPSAPGHRIGFCWPVQNEVDLRPVIERWRGDGSVACLPVVVAADAPLAFRTWTPGSALAPDRFGIPTPTAGDWVVPDLLLLPLNAFDAAGYRIGYGGGYFDRTLAALPSRPLTIGVGLELGRVESTEPQPHDVRLDWVVTEVGAFAVQGRGS
jgi:5,10-methenyltetrahydrofolate synthetase